MAGRQDSTCCWNHWWNSVDLSRAQLNSSDGGAALPLLVTGLGFGIGGAVTNLGTSCIEASINSAEIKKAEKLLDETLDSIDVVNKTVQGWLDEKEKARLLIIINQGGGGGVSKENVGSIITASMTSRFARVIFKMAGEVAIVRRSKNVAFSSLTFIHLLKLIMQSKL